MRSQSFGLTADHLPIQCRSFQSQQSIFSINSRRVKACQQNYHSNTPVEAYRGFPKWDLLHWKSGLDGTLHQWIVTLRVRQTLQLWQRKGVKAAEKCFCASVCLKTCRADWQFPWDAELYHIPKGKPNKPQMCSKICMPTPTPPSLCHPFPPLKTTESQEDKKGGEGVREVTLEIFAVSFFIFFQTPSHVSCHQFQLWGILQMFIMCKGEEKKEIINCSTVDPRS